ncbi:uncharacterized protein LOC121862668 [Homarus americanus]|uniref:uncharacterized protein LOC121862668 n=1 Tax=Homarus americanus TaxID=6706 RepID=UPI001C48307D|nr:uncharacterized protein LOC121862668 [Homarus americanus]
MLCERSHCIRQVSRLAMEDDSGAFSSRVLVWLTGIHFHTTVDPQAITYIMKLAQSKQYVANQAVMAASSMVYKLCQQDPHMCTIYSEPLLEYVTGQVGDSCGVGRSRGHQDNIKLALRALGNAGVLPYDNFPEKCYMDKSVVPELRVAALQTNRRIGCFNSKAPWKILEDVDEKVDVRIAAYLALVPCATHTPGFFTRIKRLLDHEDVNQVASYIWTHVRNLVEHPGPSDYDRELAKLASQHTLPAKFNANAFYTSHNYRYTQFIETVNLGGSVGGNVIFTPDSYIPRQASVNLTIDVLDQSLNVFELGGDFSGIENIIEGLYGKDGYFGNEEILNVLKSFRPKRNIIRDDKIEEFQKLYDEAETVNEVDVSADKEPRASVFLRVFGNEVMYFENLIKSNKMQFLQRFIKDFSTPRSFQVVDQEYISPTLLGFPLKLLLNATGSVIFNKEEKLQMRGTQDIILEGKLSPSAVVALDETLMVDGYVSSSGIRRTTTQIARTHIGGKIAIENGEILEVQINVPSPEITKLSKSVKVSLFKNSRKDWEEHKGEGEESQQQCSPDSLSKGLGLELCSSVSYKTRSLDGETIVSEPYNMDFKITKTDTFNYYKLYVKKQENVLEALFDSPGSSIDRKVHFLFNVRPNDAGVYMAIRGMGYGIEGEYENTYASKKLSLVYREESNVVGEFEVSLQNQTGKYGHKYIPKMSLTLGKEVLTLGGNIVYNKEEEHEGLEVTWELEGIWLGDDGMKTFGKIFVSSSGNLILNREKQRMQISSKYGKDAILAHSVLLTLDSSQMMEQGKKKRKGSLSMESSQAESQVEVDFEYQPGHAEVNINVTVQTIQVASQLIVKNLIEGNSKDTHLTVNFVSPQMNMDYLGQVIYKVSDHGLQAEAEVKLNSILHSKFLLMYLMETDPLHLLAGLHFHFNDFIIEFGHNIDFSQPDRAVISMSSSVGPAVAAFLYEVDYSRDHPFNASVELYGAFDIHQAGVSLYTMSDQDWHNFTGRSNLKWFDWSYSIEHEAFLDTGKKMVKFTSENSGVLEIAFETHPNFLLQFLARSGPDDRDPAFQIVIERQTSTELEMFQADIAASGDHLFQTAMFLNREKTFNGSLRLLESEVVISGKYHLPHSGMIEGSAEAAVTLPSGQAFSSNLSLIHSYDGTTRDLLVSYGWGDGAIEGHMKHMHREGWFEDDATSFNLTLTTPFSQLQNIGLSFEKLSDPSKLNFAEIELDEFKIRGEARLGDPTNFEAKLTYEDGGTCDSYFHIYHNQESHHSLTGASLAILDHSTWQVDVNTTFVFSDQEESLDVEISFQFPVLTSPFQLYGNYNITKDHLGFEIEAGMEEKMCLSFLGTKESSLSAQKLHGLAEFNSSWTEPLLMNVTVDHILENILNVNCAFQSSWDAISSWEAEFSANYSLPEDTKAHFYLTHSDLQITLDLAYNFSMSGLKQTLEGSVNTMTIRQDIDTVWDKNFVPTNIKGLISLLNIHGYNFDLSLSHEGESVPYVTEITGSLNDMTFIVEHTLELHHLLEWSSSLQITLPSVEGIIGTQVSLNAESDLSSINSTFTFTSPWTEEYKGKLIVEETNTVTDYKLDLTRGDTSVLTLMVISTDLASWYQSDLVLQVTSSFFELSEIKWKHSLDSEYLASVQVTYGYDIFVQGKSHLKFNQGWFNQEFVFYDFSAKANITDLGVQFKSLLNVDSNYTGKVEGVWNDYYFTLTSAFLDGNIFKVMAGDSESKFHSQLLYEKRNDGNLPNLHFSFARNEMDLFRFKITFEDAYPKVDALFSLEVYSEKSSTLKNGHLRLTADLANIHNYDFKGSLELKSDLEGFENLGGNLEVDVKINNHFSWKGHVNGLVNSKEWVYKANLNGSFAHRPEFRLEYGTLYEVIFKEETFDRKEIRFMMSATQEKEVQVKFTLYTDHVTPQWSLYMSYDNKYGNFKGYVMPGDSHKYELSFRLSRKTLHVSVQRINKDGSKFQYIEGNLNWIIRRVKQLIIINLNSDEPSISKITGQLVIQQKRDLAITANLHVNEDNFLGTLRYSSQSSNNPNRISIKIENNIVVTFRTNILFDFVVIPEGFTTDLTIDVDEEKDWLSGSLKVTLPESYLHFKTPFSVMETFNLTVNVEKDEHFGLVIILQVPQGCFNLTGTLDEYFLSSMLNIHIQLQCTEEVIFDFNLKYNFDRYPYSLYIDLSTHDYGLLFKFNGTYHVQHDKIDIKLESEVYPQISLGVSLLGQFGETSSNTSFFLCRLQTKDQSISLEADYDFQPGGKGINVTFSNSLFGFPLNVKLMSEFNMTKDSGSMRMHLVTDSTFDGADLSVAYDLTEEIKEGTFKLLTTNGDAEGEVTLQKNNNLLSVIANMSSSLHTFHNYYMKFIHETQGMNRTLEVQSVQDDTEFQLNCFTYKTMDELKLQLSFSTPFKIFESFEFELIHPVKYISEIFDQAKFIVKSSNETYTIEVRHNHHRAWRKQLTEITFTCPQFESHELSILLAYNLLESLGSAVLNTPQGRVGLQGTWQNSERNIAISLISFLTYFGLGEYSLAVDFPLELSQESEFHLTYNSSELAFVTEIRTGEYLRNGNISFSMNLKPESVNKIYRISYELQDSLKIDGQFDNWTAMTKLTFSGKLIPAMSGNLEIKTNVKGFGGVDGSWNIGRKDQAYITEVNIDIKQQGALKFKAAVDIEPDGSPPWDSIKVNFLFESPFTLTHHLQAEYDLRTPTLAAYYQYGLDTFKIQWSANFSSKLATFELNGEIPIQGISDFTFSLKSNFMESYTANFVARIEETTLKSSFEFLSDYKVGSILASLTSPFIRPMKAEINWSFAESPMSFKALYTAGKYSGVLEMSLDYTSNSAHFDFQLRSTSDKTSKLNVDFMYDLSDYKDIQAAIVIHANHHILNLKSNLMISEGKFALKFFSFVNVYGSNSSVDIGFEKLEKTCKGNMSGKINGNEILNISFLLNVFQFQVDVKYKLEQVFVVNVNYYQTNVQLILNDYWQFNLSTLHKSVKKGHHFGLYFNGFNIEPITIEANYTTRRHNHRLNISLKSSLMQPVTIHLTYFRARNNQLKARVTIGNKEYNLTGGANLRKRESSFKIVFHTSEDPSNPIILEAMYDLKKFLQGKMKSVMDLAFVNFEWREQLQVNVTGMRTGDQTKMTIITTTPLTSVPQFLIGYDGDFSHKNGDVDLSCTVFMEWSQQVNATAIFKLKDDEIDLKWTLMTSYPILEKQTFSFMLKPGHIKAAFMLNKEVWTVLCDYQFSPTYSIVCFVETPINGYENLSLTVSAGITNDHYTGQIDLTWPESQTVALHIQAEDMKVEFKLLTPWEPLRVVLFMASLETDEQQKYSGVIQWDKRKIVTSFNLFSTELQFVTKYSVDDDVICLAKIESLYENGELKFLIEIQTPFVLLKSLKTIFNLESQGFSAMLLVNGITNVVEGMYSINGCDFTADIPILGDLKWTLEAKNQWMEMNTEGSIMFSQAASPFIITFSYDVDQQSYAFKSLFEVVSDRKWVSLSVEYMNTWTIQAVIIDSHMEIKVMNPHDGETHLTLRLESPQWNLNLLNFNVTAKYGAQVESLDASLALLLKSRNKHFLHYNLSLRASVIEHRLIVNLELGSNQILAPYHIKCIIPLINVFYEEGKLELSVTQGEEERFVLAYETLFPYMWSSNRVLLVKSSEWSAGFLVILTQNSLNLSFSFPDLSKEHSFLVTWSDDTSFVKLRIQVELNSPFLRDGSLKLNFDYSLQQKLYGIMNFNFSYGRRKVDLSGHFQYNVNEHKIDSKFQLTSNWIGDYSIEGSVEWEKDISVSVILSVLDEEHSINLHLDITNYILKLTSRSSFLPFEEVTFTGKVNTDFKLSNMNYEGKVIVDNQEIFLDARFENENLQHINSYIIVKQNQENIFTMSLVLYSEVNRIDFDFDIYSIIPELNNNLELRYTDYYEVRDIYVRLNSFLLQNEQIVLEVTNSKSWLDTQRISLNWSQHSFFVEADVRKRICKFNLKYFYELIDFEIHHEVHNGDFDIILTSPFKYLEFFTVSVHWPADDSNQIPFVSLVHAWDDVEVSFHIIIEDDDTFGKSVEVVLLTSFKDFEKFRLVTPKFKSNGQHLQVMLEYPGGKVGIEMSITFTTLLDSQVVLGLYLPFEKYDIISLLYIMQGGRGISVIEARMGKVGFKFALQNQRRAIGSSQVVLLQVNEFSIRAEIREFLTSMKDRAYIHIDIKSKELLENHSFHIEYQLEGLKRSFLVVKIDQYELLKAHLAWGPDKVFAFTLPMIYPSSLTLNAEFTEKLEDFQVLLNFASDNTWVVAGVHMHHEVLEGGHHFSMQIVALENHFYVEGTFSVNSFHYNESLIFELNNKKMGYKSLFQREPGFFSTVHTGDIYVLLPAQTVHYKTNATSNSRELEMLSSFTWNEQDPEMPPITFKVNYNDNSFFGQMRHYLKAVFSHPDVKDIYLECDIKQDQNSPLHGSAELVDGNSPERNIVMMLDIQPVTQDGEHNIKVNISQPFSEFALTMDALVLRSVFTRGDYRFKYWSLTKEIWEDLNILTAVNTTNSGYDFSANIFSSQAKWGYSYEGDVHSWDNSATFNIQGNPSDCGEFWKFGTTINKHLPELLVYLDIGQKDQEAYEEGRLRIGLHNPVELGTVLDHKRFGEWSQDGAVGLKLITPDILQFIFEFDPSLDYSDSSFLHHLTSPGDKILNIWWHDLTSVSSMCKQWILLEAPAVLEVFVNSETVQTIWDRETSNVNYFVNEFNSAIININEDINSLWIESLQPALHAVYTFTISVSKQSLVYLESFGDYLSLHLNQLMELMKEEWDYLEGQINTFIIPLASWWTDVIQQMWEKVQTQFTGLYNVVSAWLIELSEYLEAEFMNLMKKMKSLLDTVIGTLQGYLYAIQETIQPTLDSLLQVLISYGEEIGPLFLNQCWKHISDKLESIALMREGIISMWPVVKEFLQTEAYYSHFTQASVVVFGWIQNCWSVVMGGVTQLALQAQESWRSWLLALMNLLTQIQRTAAIPVVQNEIETERITQFIQEQTPRVTQVTEDIVNFMKGIIKAFQTYAGGHFVFDYMKVTYGSINVRVMQMWEKWNSAERKNMDGLECFTFLVADNIWRVLHGTNYFLDK